VIPFLTAKALLYSQNFPLGPDKFYPKQLLLTRRHRNQTNVCGNLVKPKTWHKESLKCGQNVYCLPLT